MGTIDRGAPIDVQWLNDLNEKVEKLISASNASPYQQSSINNALFDTSGMRVMKTSETRIHAETVRLSSGANNAGSTMAFSVSLTNFASPPVATATPIVVNPSTSVKPDIDAIITSVTQNAVNGYIVFTNGVVAGITVGVSVIAIGVPSNSTGTASTNQQTKPFFTPPTIG